MNDALIETPSALLARLDGAATRHQTPTGAGNMVWRSWGSGPVLVLLHGGSGSWRHWVRNIEYFARDRRVLAPDLPGLGDFAGQVIHSEGFDSGAGWAGKRALILGTGSSANDIALDLHSHGVHTTLIQRGSTTVVSIDPSARLNEAIWDEGGLLDDCDLVVSSATPPLILRAYKAVTQRMLQLDKDLIDGLKSVGFKHDVGEDETGHQMKYFRRGGGYNLDAGSSALLAKRELGLLQYDRIERFVPEGALLKDGATVPADMLVLATGYYPQAELVRRALGQSMADKIGQIWGIGPDGELSNMFKRTPQRGAWFIAGGLAQCRINSKYLALQIKAMELGKLGPL